MPWRIYYGDGSIYDDSQGSPWDAPALNAQAVVVSDPEHGWYCCRADDFYWYIEAEDRWYSGERFGLFDYLTQPGMKKVIFGRSIPDWEYRKLLDRAMNDPDLPKKTGWQAHERRPT
jgi:hypothetical protein